MKKTDIAMIILIASVSVIGSYFVTKMILGDPNKAEVKVKTAEKITPDLVMPDSPELSKVFNKKAINPTVEVIIGDKKASHSDETDTSGDTETSPDTTDTTGNGTTTPPDGTTQTQTPPANTDNQATSP